MCGVFGWVSWDKPLSPDELSQAKVALGSLAHRGPDHCEDWHEGGVYLGHQRLKIIDLSNEANQPFADPQDRYRLIFNGEIYNYRELRRELEQVGYTFRTSSDTEVLLFAIDHWGDDALLRFDGMFAGALFDRRTQRHLIFRDPLGQKPLYYFVFDGGLLYASELRALLVLKRFHWRLDPEAFGRYVLNAYFALEDTPVAGIRKLLPGHRLIARRGGEIVIERYWNSIPGDGLLDIGEDDAVAEFSRLMNQSCERVMRSDVPYGVFLSGGIDSSLVADFCHQTNPDIRCFSVAMGERDFDESPKADQVARHLGIGHHQTFMMDRQSVLTAMDGVFGTIDEPHGDPGFINTYFLAQSCRPHLTAAIAGDGGDELFAGYLPFAGLRPAPLIGSLPGPLLSLVKSLSRLLPASDTYLGLRFLAESYLQGFPGGSAARFALWLASISPEELSEICRHQDRGFFARSALPGTVLSPFSAIMEPAEGKAAIERFLYFYQKVFLPEFVCAHTDRAAMQFGLEVRAPFLSPSIIEFANRLPSSLKMRGRTLKWLLRETAIQRGLPRSIATQRKQGFTFPVARWLKSAMRERMDDLLAPEEWSADGLVEPNVVTAYKDDHLANRRNSYRLLYNLMVFRAWRRRFPQVSSI